MDVQYLSGFANHHSSEALPGALPIGRNSPQRCRYGLYAEQFSATPFTAQRAENRRSWLYRIRPAAAHGRFAALPEGTWNHAYAHTVPSPDRLRWSPLPRADSARDFVTGMVTMAGNGGPEQQTGCALHLYSANVSMVGTFFYNADGELLIVPQTGALRLCTELGVLELAPQEVALIPRGIRFRVELLAPLAEGYVCENFGRPFALPELGPVGANGLAQTRDFLAPTAAFEDVEGEFALIAKFAGRFFHAPIGHSPLDVVAWHGNCAPLKYDLRRFNTLGSISFDHPDPSLLTVLSSPSDIPGVGNVDFVLFPPRILAMQDTFRPPWYHRNVASEFMGLIEGRYDARSVGFEPGGVSLHNSMSAHGPDKDTFLRARSADLREPDVLRDTLAFMFETRCLLRPSAFALASPALQSDYDACWQHLPKLFHLPGDADERDP